MIRDFVAPDAEGLAALQLASIMAIGPTAYAAEQVAAWAARAGKPARFSDDLRPGSLIRVACDDAGALAGYCLIEADGHLDHLYVHPDHVGSGHACALIKDAHTLAAKQGLSCLYSEVSEIARPVFEKCGWHVQHRRDLEIDGVAIHNYAMTRQLG